MLYHSQLRLVNTAVESAYFPMGQRWRFVCAYSQVWLSKDPDAQRNCSTHIDWWIHPTLSAAITHKHPTCKAQYVATRVDWFD